MAAAQRATLTTSPAENRKLRWFWQLKSPIRKIFCVVRCLDVGQNSTESSVVKKRPRWLGRSSEGRPEGGPPRKRGARQREVQVGEEVLKKKWSAMEVKQVAGSEHKNLPEALGERRVWGTKSRVTNRKLAEQRTPTEHKPANAAASPKHYNSGPGDSCCTSTRFVFCTSWTMHQNLKKQLSRNSVAGSFDPTGRLLLGGTSDGCRTDSARTSCRDPEGLWSFWTLTSYTSRCP